MNRTKDLHHDYCYGPFQCFTADGANGDHRRRSDRCDQCNPRSIGFYLQLHWPETSGKVRKEGLCIEQNI